MEKGKLSELKQYYPKTLGDNYTWIAEQDIETAKNLKNTLDKLDVDEKDYSIKKYYFENIFLVSHETFISSFVYPVSSKVSQ